MTTGWQSTEGQGHFSVTLNGSRSTFGSFFLESSLVKSGHSTSCWCARSLEFISVPRTWPVLSWGSDACCSAPSVPVTYFLGATCSRVCLLGLRLLAWAPCSKKMLRFFKSFLVYSAILLYLSCMYIKSIWLYCNIFSFYWSIIHLQGFPSSSVGKESACNAGDPGSIPGSGRSTGEGIGSPLQFS